MRECSRCAAMCACACVCLNERMGLFYDFDIFNGIFIRNFNICSRLCSFAYLYQMKFKKCWYFCSSLYLFGWSGRLLLACCTICIWSFIYLLEANIIIHYSLFIGFLYFLFLKYFGNESTSKCERLSSLEFITSKKLNQGHAEQKATSTSKPIRIFHLFVQEETFCKILFLIALSLWVARGSTFVDKNLFFFFFGFHVKRQNIIF